MATLIPRKQIEEQRDFTASIDIGGNLSVSGSFILSQSFTMGSNPTDTNRITGSVLLSGSLIVDGNIEFDDIDRVLNLTASQALQSQDTFRYAGILARDFGANVPTLYVSSTDGDDNNDGRSIQYPLRTVKRAAQLATPGFDGRYGLPSGSLFSGYVIRVQAGTYFENNPVILPKNTTIWGSGLRITKINALNPEQDLFHVNSGCYIAEITMGGLRLWPDQINPERGFGVAFQPGAFITTSPYVQNCSQISNQENSFTELYEEIPPGGGGLYVNGDVVHPDSPLASMVLDAYTQISPNGVGCLVNGRGFIQLVSFFTNFSYYAIRVNNGGHATLNNSNISFGLFGMYASGSRKIDAISGGNEDAKQRVRESYSVIVDVLNKGLEEGLPSVTTLNTDEGIKVTQFTQSFSNNVATQKEINQVGEDFRIISEIVKSGPNEYPTLLAKSSDRGYDVDNPYNITGGTQFTSSFSASASDLLQISSSYRDLLSIFADGTGSFVFKSNNDDAVKVTNVQEVLPVGFNQGPGGPLYNNVSSSFDTIIKIVNGGRLPAIVSNASASLYLGNIEPTLPTQPISSSVISNVSSSFSIIYNILNNGTGSPILDIPENHQTEFEVVRGANNSGWIFDGEDVNPTLTLFRGTTYKFNVSGSFSKFTNPFFIRTEPRSGFIQGFDYNDGVINNGDAFGLITFTVPFNAPDELYYVSQNSSQMVGKFTIVNNSETPFELIESTMTYPTLVNPSLTASVVGDVTASYNILNSNLNFLKDETITYLSSSWAGFEYDSDVCKRDIGFIIDAVRNDLLFGGNSGSITAGLEYYLQPNMATTSQKDATLTAIKFLSDTSQNILRSSSFQQIDISTDQKYTLWTSIIESKPFVQAETIAYLSSSWSEFDYNEISCSRDIGFILNAVATDLLYGGNERSVTAGDFYYQFPSVAVTDQLIQTIDGIKYASGTTLHIISGSSFEFPQSSTSASVSLLRQNRQLIQNETIQFINATFPTLDYNEVSCSRDTGFILDAITTDLLYGGNERSITAGNFYYRFPSIATSVQRRETIAGIKYSKILADFIVQNFILETPRVITNNEKLIKIASGSNNITSSVSGTEVESSIIKSNFGIVGDIIRGGLDITKRAVAKNKLTEWSVTNPINVADGIQFTTTQSLVDFTEEIGDSFEVVATIVSGGLSVAPPLQKSINGRVKVNNIQQITGSFVENYVTSSISASFGLVVKIISNGTGSIPTVIPNTDENIFVGNVLPQTGSFINPSYITSVSQSYSVVTNIVSGGLAVSPAVVKNTFGNVRTKNTQLFSSSLVATSTEVDFVSASFAIVLDIVENGTGSLPTVIEYTTQSSNPIILNAYNNIKNNIPFIQAETIAYLSSSWSEFSYNEASCSRDIGFIVSGAAEDLLYNSNSSSIVNGKFYYDFPSAAIISGSGSPSEEAQLLPTLDGIRYASELAQKVIVNTPFVTADVSDVEVANLLVNNKEFLRTEAIEYISSSWSFFNYNDLTCKRDIGFIIDAIATDLIYGGNERVVNAGEYYYEIPSQATGTQLIQTLEAINYVSTLSQKLIEGVQFVAPDNDALEASRLLLLNNELISSEVVSYVSSSWSNVLYNELSCSRDVKHIIDAARTDLVYGGNERSVRAGEFYFLYPSRATVGGVPSEAAQLDPTVTGIEYGSELSQQIALNRVLTLVSSSKLDVVDVVRENIQFIKDNTIEYVNAFYPFLQYNEASCSRDVGFILDGVLTDLVYGGNQRSITSGDFYYRFPSLAIAPAQKVETVDGIRYAGEVTKLVSVNQLIDGVTIGRNIDNTIKVTNVEQFISAQTGSQTEVSNVSSSFAIVLDIVENGTGSLPEITTNNELGIKITDILQITSSISASATEINKVSSSFATVLDIVEYGISSLPVIVNNTIDNIKVTNTSQFISVESGSINEANIISSSFAIVLDIVKNGTGSLPTIIDNIEGTIKVTSIPQITSASGASQNDIDFVSASFAIVLDMVENGTGSYTASVYGSPSSDVNTVAAYNLLKDNIPFIQGETIAYISSSWSDFGYDEDKCKRDVGFIVSGAAEDLLHGIASASVVNGKYYFEFPSSAILSGSGSPTSASQLFPTLDGIRYASKLSEKIIQNVVFVTASLEVSASNVLLNENRQFIKNEAIAYLSSSWSNFSYNEDTCKRDIGFIIDAVRTDLVYGGNERSVNAGEFYYLYPSAATVSGSVSPTSASQLFPTLDGIQYAGRLSEKVIQNIVFETASIERVTTGELLINNINLIKEETITYLSSSWSDFDYNQDTCKRDIGFIVDAVRTDVVYGGNERSVTAGDFYYRFPSAATVSGSVSPTSASQLYPTLDGIRYASRLSDKLIQNTLLVTASLEASASNVLLNENRQFIKEETIAYLSSSWSDFSYNEDTCKRDIGFIIDAVRTDLVYGGNERSVTAGDFYYRFPSAAILSGSVSPTTATQLYPTLDGIRYAGDVSQKLVGGSVFQTASLEISASVDLLRKNRGFIQRETIEYVSSSWSQVVYNEASCSRDTGFIVDAVTTDLLYGGEERSINAADFYYRFPSRATVAGVPSEAAQLDPTLTGIRYAGGVSSKIVLNQHFTFPSQSVLNGRALLIANKQFIQKETIAFLSSSWSGLDYNEVSCSRDLGFIIDAISTDLVYGGNESSLQAGTYYYIKPSVAIIDSYADNFGQRQQTVDGINFARGVAEKVVAQTQLVFPGQRRLEAAQRLVAAKEELKRRALSYTNGAFPNLVYNEASCSRDTGLIVDALATDLIYGGNERGIEAATSYFTGQYGSAAEVVNNQRLETLETNRYLRTRAEFIAANAPQEDFGSLIVATGIDYSYNGSGVTFKALPPNQGGSGVPDPDFEITELGGGRIFFTSGNQDGDFRIGTGLTINQATGTLVGRTFSKSLFSLVTPFSLALEG